jgi:UDP-N-acetylmuramoylalanine--D-glutamate ligase
VDAKARIFQNQRSASAGENQRPAGEGRNQPSGDFAVLNADDPTSAALKDRVKGSLYWFSRKKPVESGACLQGDQIVFRHNGGEQSVLARSEIQLKGAHNLENVLAAVAMSMIAGCAPDQVRRAVTEFHAVEHRLELVATVNGVAFYNDSKATNVDATAKALESFPGKIHIILGGKDKGSDYSVLNPLLRERVKRAYLIGAAAEKIASQVQGAATLERSGTLERAVRRAAEAASPGDVVLLAPACASFDQFENYEHRGRVFKELVLALSAVPLGERA